MRFIVGEVVDNADKNTKKDGQFQAKFENVFGQEHKPVTYTSPYYRVNMGGFVAIPEAGTQILALYNDQPLSEDEDELYFHSCIVKDNGEEDSKTRNPQFQAIRDNDKKAKIYSKTGKPVTQAFTNGVGGGIYIQRDFDSDSINNNTTIKSENDCYVNVGALGIQIVNNEGDCIALQSSTENDFYATRGLNIVTKNQQEYKCLSSDMTIKIVDGGDLNIENNSTGNFLFKSPLNPPPPGIAGVTPRSGNVRLKSRWRDISLAALGPGSKIHIVTNTSKIVLDGNSGAVDIFAPGGLNINSAGAINMNAGGGINMNSGGPINLNAVAPITTTSRTAINNNAQLHNMNDTPIFSINPAGTTQQTLPFVAYQVDVPPITPPIPDDYNDGFPGGGAV